MRDGNNMALSFQDKIRPVATSNLSFKDKIKPIAKIPVESGRTEDTGIIGDALKTLIFKPAVRFGQVIGTPIAKALGATPEGIERASNAPVEIPIGDERKITIEPQKALGQGGGTQIFSDALKSATYLAPYGKIAGGATKLASNVLGQGVARIAGGVAAGVAGGYAVDVSQNLDEMPEVTGETFMPGFATLIGGLSGGVLEAGVIGLEKLTQGARSLGKELELQSFKLTPTQKTNLGSKLDEMVDFSSKNIPSGTPEQRFAYADDLYEAYEENLQFFLETVAKENRLSTSVQKSTLVRQLNSLKGAYKYDRDAQAIYKQIDDAILTLKNQYKGETIPVDKLNIFKRSTFKNAYNKAGSKVLDTVEHDIGDAVKVAIERATKGGMIGDKSVGQFNKEYGNIIQLRKLLKLAQNRPELGFTKRITARIIAGIIGNALGGVPGIIGAEFIAEPIAKGIAGTQAKTNIARKLMEVKPKQIGSVIQRLRP